MTGCASAVTSLSGKLADTVASGVMNQNDPATVETGAPAYLILIDGLIEDSPDDPSLLARAARLYSTYALIFVDDPQRATRMTVKARNYGQRAICQQRAAFCSTAEADFDQFSANLVNLEDDDVPAGYAWATGWAAWIQANKSDWHAIADIPKLEALLNRLLTLDEDYDNGGVHTMLGIIATRLPASLGGTPELGREHFQRAIQLSEGKNLMTKVLFARHYARLVFDRALHDALLTEVINSEADIPGMVLINTLAQEEAATLLSEADDYF
jgi:hypothetical protein